MKRFRDIPIRQKLVAIVMVTSTLTLLLASAAFLSYELITFRKGMLQSDWQDMSQRLGQYASIGLLVLLASFIIAFFLSS